MLSFHPQALIWGGNKIFGLPFPSKLNEAATKEYADRVGVDARKHADRVVNSPEGVCRSIYGIIRKTFPQPSSRFFKR